MKGGAIVQSTDDCWNWSNILATAIGLQSGEVRILRDCHFAMLLAKCRDVWYFFPNVVPANSEVKTVTLFQ